jgi:hypothetical protein
MAEIQAAHAAQRTGCHPAAGSALIVVFCRYPRFVKNDMVAAQELSCYFLTAGFVKDLPDRIRDYTA